MQTINFIQTTPTELASLISEAVRQELKQNSLFAEVKRSHPEKELLTRKETAELFAVSLVTIHDWCKNGILKPYKVGNRTYFKRSEVFDVVSKSNVA
jgi:excisionase family DNA binding protein